MGQTFIHKDVIMGVAVPSLDLIPRSTMTPCVFVAWFSPECQTCHMAAVQGGQAFHLHSSCHHFDMQSQPHSRVLPPVLGRSGLQPSFSLGCGPAMSQERPETWRSCTDVREGNSLCLAGLSLPSCRVAGVSCGSCMVSC